MDFDVTSEAGIIWIERRNCEERCYKLSELEGGDVYKIDEKLMQEKKNNQMHGPQNNSFLF